MTHKDSDPVTFSYASSANVTFHGTGYDTGYIWGDWREMSESEQQNVINELAHELIDISIDGDES